MLAVLGFARDVYWCGGTSDRISLQAQQETCETCGLSKATWHLPRTEFISKYA